ncbi:MAG TPA: hypothetical protein VNO21_27370 [Polyangiaceae bacterium]|nr:hypothetical protein [Polyangiaceae bacterium]
MQVGRAGATSSDAPRSDRTRAASALKVGCGTPHASGAANEGDEHALRERQAVAFLLRTAADGVARKTYALEQLADRTRGASQATVYKALEALEKERAIFSDLSERIDTVREPDWESFKDEALSALETVREPDDDPDDPTNPPLPPHRKAGTGSSAAAKH